VSDFFAAFPAFLLDSLTAWQPIIWMFYFLPDCCLPDCLTIDCFNAFRPDCLTAWLHNCLTALLPSCPTVWLLCSQAACTDWTARLHVLTLCCQIAWTVRAK
jgi:hypothetical protein